MSLDEAYAEMARQQQAIDDAAWAAVRRLGAELAEAARPVWRTGDGQGGVVYRELWEAFEAAGLDVYRSFAYEMPTQVKTLALRDGWACHYCGVPLGYGHELVTEPQIEHVLPKSRGGKLTKANLVLACTACNRDKGTRTPEEWRGRPCCSNPAHTDAVLL